MTPLLFDAATPWDAKRLKYVKQRGAVAVSVYIVGSPGGMRHAVKADVDLIRKQGLGCLPNWERAADFFRTASIAHCKAAGVEAAKACRALGFPDNAGIGVAFSFDYQVQPSDYDEATEKLAACNQGMAGAYQAIGYGQMDLIDYWAVHGLPGPHWLMASTWRKSSAFTASEVQSRNVALVQSHDAQGNWLDSPATYDINTLTQPDKLPAWWPDGSPYGGNMALTDKDAGTVWAHTAGIWNKSKPSAWAILSNLHLVGHQALDAVSAVASAVGSNAKRLAAIQATQAAQGKQLEQVLSELAALKAAQANVQIDPVDVPVTGTVHIGGSK